MKTLDEIKHRLWTLKGQQKALFDWIKSESTTPEDALKKAEQLHIINVEIKCIEWVLNKEL